MCNNNHICANCQCQKREDKIKELLKDLEIELPQPLFEKVKGELLDLIKL